jgi:hypothetical protein
MNLMNQVIDESIAEIVDAAHRKSVTTPLPEVTKQLIRLLGQTLTAFMVNVTAGRTVVRWADGENLPSKNSDVQEKLRTAFQVTELLTAAFASSDVAKAWLIGLNPRLDDMRPVEAIREGRLREVIAAARDVATQ